MDRFAPPLALVGNVLGCAPVHVDLHRAATRWTVLVFERSADARRLHELASVRGNFVAEDAALLIVAPTPAEWAECEVPVVHDEHDAVWEAFGAAASTTVVIAPDGVIWHTVSGPECERRALDFIAGVRMGVADRAA